MAIQLLKAQVHHPVMLTEEYFLALAGVQKCWDAWKAWAKLEELP